MGLDRRPLAKPKAGFKERSHHLFHLVQGTEKVQLSFLDSLKGKPLPNREDLLQGWFSVQIKMYETIKAPRFWQRQNCRRVAERSICKIGPGHFFDKYRREMEGIFFGRQTQLGKKLD